MQYITFEQAADLLDIGSIEQTIDLGHSTIHIINIGTADQPCRYVLANDVFGQTMISPSLFN